MRTPPMFNEHPASFSDAQKSGFVRGVCMHVVDGDTADFFVDLGWFQYAYVTLRFARIDAAELRGTSGKALRAAKRAKARVEELSLHQCVLVHAYKDKTSFGRFVSEVYTPEFDPDLPEELRIEACGHGWVSISDLLVYEGLAKPLELDD